nr:hypothetical protein [Lachnospiraceae bacterium]
NMIKKIIFIFLFMLVLCGFNNETGKAGVNYNARVNYKNVMKLLNKYDQDGAYMVRFSKQKGDDVMNWFDKGEPILDGLDTAVHEECHYFTNNNYTGSYYNLWYSFYRGSGNPLIVSYNRNNVYDSIEMKSIIPSSARTFRFNTYIGAPKANLASNVCGLYGIMNEFNAYMWGMNNNVKFYNYYVSQNRNYSPGKVYNQISNQWFKFANNGASNRLAYYEFKYYALTYMIYAKKHYPKVYSYIMNDKKIRRAYKLVERKYKGLVKEYESQLNSALNLLNQTGYYAYIKKNKGDKYFFVGYHLSSNMGYKSKGTAIFYTECRQLKKQLRKSKYKRMHRILTY